VSTVNTFKRRVERRGESEFGSLIVVAQRLDSSGHDSSIGVSRVSIVTRAVPWLRHAALSGGRDPEI
jgi:hypothetical protein